MTLLSPPAWYGYPKRTSVQRFVLQPHGMWGRIVHRCQHCDTAVSWAQWEWCTLYLENAIICESCVLTRFSPLAFLHPPGN